MRRLLMLIAIAAVAWYGWKHYGSLRPHEGHEIVVVNESDKSLARVRVTAGDHTEVIETIAAGASEKRDFPLSNDDAAFKIVWFYERSDVETTWNGGTLSAGPLAMKHTFRIQSGGDVIWSSEPRPTKSGSAASGDGKRGR